MEDVKDKVQIGIRIGGENIIVFRFADGLAYFKKIYKFEK